MYIHSPQPPPTQRGRQAPPCGAALGTRPRTPLSLASQTPPTPPAHGAAGTAGGRALWGARSGAGLGCERRRRRGEGAHWPRGAVCVRSTSRPASVLRLDGDATHPGPAPRPRPRRPVGSVAELSRASPCVRRRRPCAAGPYLALAGSSRQDFNLNSRMLIPKSARVSTQSELGTRRLKAFPELTALQSWFTAVHYMPQCQYFGQVMLFCLPVGLS